MFGASAGTLSAARSRGRQGGKRDMGWWRALPVARRSGLGAPWWALALSLAVHLTFNQHSAAALKIGEMHFSVLNAWGSLYLRNLHYAYAAARPNKVTDRL